LSFPVIPQLPPLRDCLHRLAVVRARPWAPSIVLALMLGACVTPPPPAAPPRMQSPPPVAVMPAPGAPSNSPAEIVASQARAMLGQPYRFGGAAPGGFDCSGLVQYAAHAAGLAVPRTAEEQLRSGVAIARAALASGDLVFMHLAGKELHVGIALDGMHFIHAPSSGGRVRIDSLEAPPYARGFFAARRIAAR
jgi:cell wall-associated NlpC family hydrolase